MPRRVFYGWWMVAAGFTLQVLSGGLYFHSFGAYFVYLHDEFGWSRTLLAGAFSLARLETGVLGPLQGWLINQIGPRALMTAGMLAFGIAFMLLGRIESIAGFYMVFLLLTGGAGLAGGFTVNVVLANWFERRRAMAMAFAGTGHSVGGLLVPMVAAMLGTFGWRPTTLISGVIALLIGIPLVQFFRPSPERYGYAPDGRSAPEPQRPDGRAALVATIGGVSAREAVRSAPFWLLSAGHSAALVSVSAIMVHLIPYLVIGAEMSVAAAASIVALVTGTCAVGHVAAGLIGDRMEKRLIVAACMVGHTLALVVLVASTALGFILVFAVLHGLSWGLRGALMSAIRADYFGRRSFATIEGYVSLITMLGTIVGPILAGAVADGLGDYRPAFVCLAVATAAGGVSFFMAGRPGDLLRRSQEVERARATSSAL
jgi:sugar phosphate permease